MKVNETGEYPIILIYLSGYGRITCFAARNGSLSISLPTWCRSVVVESAPRRSKMLSNLPREVAREIQISGQTNFAANRWREAILYYLFGVWGDKSEVMYRPKIHLGPITLRLNPSAETYYAHAVPLLPEDELNLSLFSSEEMISVGPRQTEVETGLIRFVKNGRIKLITIHLDNGGLLRLWKGNRRGDLFLQSWGVPSMMELVRSGDSSA